MLLLDFIHFFYGFVPSNGMDKDGMGEKLFELNRTSKYAVESPFPSHDSVYSQEVIFLLWPCIAKLVILVLFSKLEPG